MWTSVVVIPTAFSWLWNQIRWNNLTILFISVTLLALALLLDSMKRRKRCSRYPPGPTPLPFIGNLLEFDRRNPHKCVLSLVERYGPILSVQVGWKKIVILSGFQTIKEALGQKTENFAERSSIPLLSIIGRGKNCEGILMATSDNGWREQKRFWVSNLKKLGMGKKTLEKRVCEEAGYLCAELKSQEGFPFDPHDFIYTAVGNITCTLVFGDPFDYHSKSFLSLMHLTEEIMQGATKILPLFFIYTSWFSYLPGPQQKLKKDWDDFSTIIKEIVNEHKKTRDTNNPKDLIDAFLEEIEKAEGNTETSFNEQNLIHLLLDIFAAGIETTAATLTWGILFMVLHPEVQKKVHEEIDAKIGGVKSVVMEDRSNLPYTTAVIHEIQRYADIAPVTFPYVACNDTEVGRFLIPKDTVVLNHLSSVLKDETMWEKPHEFYPEHFLDANGQFVKREAFLPFSLGRHACFGEPLAKMELFIFFTNLMQHFTFCIPENAPRPSEERIFRLTVFPLPFQIFAFPR
ncbi:cytochrome P450 2D14-like [Anolis sagrei]|uniref:cytochrome P450 2D14-like n=1 Tax=Anolis sagrei TaxID=38937 RepID=UPI0035209A1F